MVFRRASAILKRTEWWLHRTPSVSVFEPKLISETDSSLSWPSYRCVCVCSDTTLRCARWSSWSRTACRRRDSTASAPSWLRTSQSCAHTSETSPCLTSKTFWRAYVNTRTKLERLPLNRSVSVQHECDLVWMWVSVFLLFARASRIKIYEISTQPAASCLRDWSAIFGS